MTSSLHSLVARMKLLGVQFIDAYEQEIGGKIILVLSTCALCDCHV